MGSHVLVKSCHERTLKIQSFWARERPTISTISFKLSRSRPYPHPGRLISCKSELVDFDERTSPNEVRKEIERCYELIHRLGRGVVYLGSSRMGPDHSHYLQALELGREIANLLECTSWTGAGPGLMDAATKGALQAGKSVGGFKIGKEADAAVRSCSSDRTAVVALPGGIGTLDEIFEILALIQLERIGSELPVPFLLMNYDSFYSKLLGFLDDCEDWGTLSKGEITSLWKVCDSNSEALAYLADFYKLPPPTDKARHDNELQSASGTFS
ncbi:unnamed protein product [Prunus armeniaca]|uniref:Uncharacterized protein n=1 Tax=Prunus armeniaca TaxID=36596 RepID=A0A6J5UQ05_PRUAR|nr:unnamed protein product [Prunus armeniaca]